MKKAMVDYREFRFSRWREPRFSHLKLLLSWVIYLLFFLLTEALIAPETCYSVHCPLDDRIPFYELFLIPYVLWYGLIVYTLIYFLLYDIESFRNLSWYLIVVQIVSVLVYIVFPTRQDLRPDYFERDNFLTRCVAALYRIDTNTGVCPSFHVSCSIAIAAVWWRSSGIRWRWKILIGVLCCLICLSTMFIKQHSAVDFFAALPVCAVAQWYVYRNKRLRQ